MSLCERACAFHSPSSTGCAGQAELGSRTRGSNPTQPPVASVTPSLATPRLPVISTGVLEDLEIVLMLSDPKKEAAEPDRRTDLGKEQKKEHFLDLWH